MNNQIQTINQNTFRNMPVLERFPSKAGRLYQLPDGRYVPGVTTVLEIIAKPALLFWSASEERKHCVSTAEQVFQEVMDSDYELDDEGVMQLKLSSQFHDLLQERLGRSFACVRKSRDAANIGTELHQFAERLIREQLGESVGVQPQLSEPALLASMALTDWMKSVKFQPLAVELTVYDPWLNYSGTLDWVARVNGVLTVGDWKTGKGKVIYSESFLQNAAYLSALRKQCRLGEEMIQGAIVKLPKFLEDVTANPIEVKILNQDDQKSNFLAFLKALDLWRWKFPNAAPAAAKVQSAIPTASAKSAALAPKPPAQKWRPPARPLTPKPAPRPLVRSNPS